MEEEENTIRLNSERDVPKDISNMEVQIYPRKVNTFLVQKPKTFAERLMFWKKREMKMINPEIKQPFMFFLKEDGYIDIIEGVKSGLFVYTNKDTGKRKGIILSPKKMQTINLEPYPKCWIAYENEISPYPVDVYMDSEELEGIVRKIETNKGMLKDEASLLNAKTLMYTIIIAGIILVGYLGFSQGWFTGLFG